MKTILNGKESKLSNSQLANLLKGKNEKGIKSLDLVSEPSAASDASFEGAVININTIPIIDGYQIGFSSRTYLRYTQLSQSAYLDFFINKNTFIIYGDFSLYRSGWQEVGSIERTISNQKLSENNVDDIVGSGSSYSLGIDFLPSAVWNMGVKLDGYKDIGDKTLNGRPNVGKVSQDSINYIFTAEATGQSFFIVNYNIFYSSEYNNSTATLDIDYGRILNSWNQDQALSTFLFNNNVPISNLNSTQNIKSENKLKGLKIDLVHNLNDIKVQGGISVSSTQINQALSETCENFILRGPNTLRGKKHVGYQIGIRGEHTDYKAGEEVSMAETSLFYFQLFPRATFYKRFDKHYISVSYRRSIRRPRFDKLTHYNRYTVAFSYYSGNPDLRA